MSNETWQADIAALKDQVADQAYEIQTLNRKIDELLYGQRLADVAMVDHVKFTSLPKTIEPNDTGQGAGNPLIVHAHLYVPRHLDVSTKHPLIVLVHGGIHANHDFGALNTVRELLVQGYTVIAPDYRGSTGYGKPFWEAIDYGGREVDDARAARTWAVDALEHIDATRVGVVGWSHGGLIALFNIFNFPEEYAACYAAVPVSDLIARMGYKSSSYRDLFSAPYHIGKTAEQDVAEYRRRSPSWQTERYSGTPLLIHTTTNDEDVNVLEVERLIQALQAGGHEVESRIYPDAPGGHAFNRLDTSLARESRREAWRFLAPYLRPERPPV